MIKISLCHPFGYKPIVIAIFLQKNLSKCRLHIQAKCTYKVQPSAHSEPNTCTDCTIQPKQPSETHVSQAKVPKICIKSQVHKVIFPNCRKSHAKLGSEPKTCTDCTIQPEQPSETHVSQAKTTKNLQK